MTDYYADKIDQLCDIFGVSVHLDDAHIVVGDRRYPIVDDVIVVSDPAQYTETVRESVGIHAAASLTGFSEIVQYSFGREWTTYGSVLPDHGSTFAAYFDLVDLSVLEGKRVADLGCGSGRWSHYLADRCREVVLVDFSDAIFVARANLAAFTNCIFIMGDITDLPFRDDFADMVVCLGVLMHLPTPCLDHVRSLARLAPRSLVYIYYALDHRPTYFRVVLGLVSWVRSHLSRLRSPLLRRWIARAIAIFVYVPVIWVGRVASVVGLEGLVPLYEGYRTKSFPVLEHNAYDRFFTAIEQRVTRAQVEALSDTFSAVRVSDHMPYWHFLCERADAGWS